MLEYGAMIQIHMNKNVESLVNEGVEGKSEFVQIPATDFVIEYRNDTSAAKYYGNNLYCQSKIRMAIGFGGTAIEDIVIKIDYGDKVITKTSTDFAYDSSSKIYIYLMDAIELR